MTVNFFRKPKAYLLKRPFFEVFRHESGCGFEVYFIAEHASFEQLLEVSDLREIAGYRFNFPPVLHGNNFYFWVLDIDDRDKLESDLKEKFGSKVEVVHYYQIGE